MLKKTTILLPLHSFDDLYKEMYINAVNSVEDFHNDVILNVICPKEVADQLNFPVTNKVEIKITVNEGKTDFCSQINLGIANCETEWFSILEVDDEYQKNWLKTVSEYSDFYKDVDVFLPIIKDVNKSGEFVSFTNESVWAYGFSENQGFLDNEILLEYQNYQTSGGLYRTKTIQDNGSFKDNIKLTFGYEFLLRMTHNGVKVMGIPKIGYVHVNLRDNSLFWEYKNNDKMRLSEKEVKFWLETAKKEFFFKNKRDVKYEEN